ncbi:MAG: hypothetical protein OEL83_13020 [Desulforhopalus sp.]|nr:hypothetical protein [Desulforhopalus sp.]
MELNFFFYLFVVAMVLFLGAVLKAFALKKENTLLAEQLTETSISLERTRQNFLRLQESHEKIGNFQNSMGEAELTTKLQKPRLAHIHTPEMSRNTPERYSYIHSLAEKGLSVEEIAQVLTISTHEANQVMTLAKIAQGN